MQANITDFMACSSSTSGVAQWLACWAHNPKVRGSKPRSAIGSVIHWIRRGGGIEPLHVSMPRELKSRPSTSPTHPGHQDIDVGV